MQLRNLSIAYGALVNAAMEDQRMECDTCVVLVAKLNDQRSSNEEQHNVGSKMIQKHETYLRTQEEVTTLTTERYNILDARNIQWEKAFQLHDEDFATYRDWAASEVERLWGLVQTAKSQAGGNVQSFAIGDAGDEDDEEGDDSSDSESDDGDKELTADSFRSADAGVGSALCHRSNPAFVRSGLLHKTCSRAPRTAEHLEQHHRGLVAETHPFPGVL